MDDSGRPRQREFRDVDVTDQAWGSDLVADLLKGYGFEFISFNPGASFRGLEESIVNYNDNDPTVVTTPNESLSVSIAHGYAKATGQPAVCVLHDVVGTLNAGMAIYNAYADNVPVVILSGTGPMRKSKRRPWIDWIHTAHWQGNLVREYTKWDDQPADIDGVIDSITRAVRVANTPPKGPVYVTLDHDVQECPLDEPVVLPDLEKRTPPAPMAPDPAAVERAADLLVAAEMPVIIVDQVGDSRPAVEALVELAETLGAPVVDKRQRRYNFPNTHPMDLTGTGIHRKADLLLAIDVWDVTYTTQEADSQTHTITETIEGDYDLVTIGTDDLGISSLVPDYYAIQDATVSMLADSALAIPAVTAAVADRLDADPGRAQAAEERFDALARQHDEQREEWRALVEEHRGETPVAPVQLAQELWEIIRDDEWVLTTGRLAYGGWPHKLWEIDEFDRYYGGDSGGGGVGYGIGAAVGGALAYRDTNRTPINLQQDGDLFQYPNALWVLGHLELPLLTVVHNNQSLYNSTNHRIQLASYRGRDASLERAMIGTGLDEPVPDWASVAEAFGVDGYGPVEDPDDLQPVLTEAWEAAKAGRPVLVDVVSQPR